MVRLSSSSSRAIPVSAIREAYHGNLTPLILTIRNLLLRVLQSKGLPQAIAEELAQEHTLPLVECFCKGEVQQAAWFRYTYRTASRLAATYHWRASRQELVGDSPWWGDASEGGLTGPSVAFWGSDAPSAEELLLRGEQEAQLHRALASIPAADRLLLTRIYLEDVPLPALLSGGSRDALYKRHERAKARLRKAMADRTERNPYPWKRSSKRLHSRAPGVPFWTWVGMPPGVSGGAR
ncbi:MAG: sigma-70 family RNA polymerase sigma factor [Myxococcales bacterium]|nr:sigma-70 family RNA polymerase sigma factor [Polyangiaceae bacterium]MDW8250199.1 sigma-70 family RNA polymerase sigma factor [Myxococcales bacterium]